MMAAPLEAPPSGSGADSNEDVEVCLFEESADGFSRTVRAIAELTAGKPELDFPESEVERIASSVTFLREWRHFSYDPKGVGFTDDSETPSSRNDVHSITLPQFSSASVPQITKQEDQKDTTDSFDFILFAGGNVWALDWCPRFSDKPGSSINCEYLSVAAHPPGSSYHKLGLPLTGRGIIQVWCLLAPFEDAHSCQSLKASNTSSRRGRPRKMPDGNNSSVSNSSNPPKPRGRPRKIPDGSNPVGSSPNPPKPRGRPRKIPDGSNTVGSSPNLPKPRGRPRKRPIDLSEPVPKRPRGRPRKNPLPVDIVEDSGREVIKVNKKDIGNDTPHCNTENGQTHVAPICQSDGIEGVESAEFVRIEESREDGNKLSYIENSKSSPIPKDVALPRVVLCLAHNGKVAWDIKWKPLIPSQPEQESCLGFLAVLLGNGCLEVWEVPSPHMIQKIYSPSKVEGSDPRFLKLQPVFRCAKVKCGNRQSIPLTVDWSPSPPHDMILAGCHDGMVALWKFSTNFSSQDSKPVMCVTADSVPIRSLSWAPYISGENINTFVTAGEDGLKFWDLRDPYRPLWELTTAPRAVLSLHWLKDARGIVISLEDGTLKFLSLPRIANDVPVTGRPFIGSKTQGVSTYQLSEYLIWSVHASEITGYAAYCGADGTAVHFQLTSRYWEKEPGRNRAPYFLCGSLSEEGGNIKIGSNSGKFPLSNVPLGAKKGPKSFQDVVQVQDVGKIKLNNTPDSGDFLPLTVSCENSEFGDDCQEDTHDEEQGAGAIVLAGPMEQENNGILNTKACESPKDFEVFPPKSVALHRVRWNTNKGSERWLCYGGAAGIVRCQRI